MVGAAGSAPSAASRSRACVAGASMLLTVWTANGSMPGPFMPGRRPGGRQKPWPLRQARRAKPASHTAPSGA
eukprot:2750171-Lingulodinium_polyedra.AAC.1